MKDELTKYKERNEALEAEVAKNAPSGPGHTRSMSAKLRMELENLRSQLEELRQHSEQSTSQNEELQNHIRTLKAEYDQTLSQQQTEHSERVAGIEAEVGQLQNALGKAQREAEENLSLNRQLNSELRSALNRPQSPGRGDSSNANEPWSETKRQLEQEVASALNRAEWLKRENAALEDRCRESESKVTLL